VFIRKNNMNPVQFKKKEYKKNLRIFPFLILSVLIHWAIFVAFSSSWNKSKNQEKKWKPESTIVKISLNNDSNIKKNDILRKEKKKVENRKQVSSSTKSIQKTLTSDDTNKKSVPLNKNMPLKINPELKSKEDEKPEISNSDSYPSQKETVTLINPFGFLKLPKSLLGQNLFPKKYEANFKLKEKNGKIIEFYFQGLVPIQDQMSYMDNTIQKAFENQIKNIPKDLLLNWLESLQGIYETPPSTSSPKPNLDSFSIILEFQEPN
jgi:hypothetical protein